MDADLAPWLLLRPAGTGPCNPCNLACASRACKEPCQNSHLIRLPIVFFTTRMHPSRRRPWLGWAGIAGLRHASLNSAARAEASAKTSILCEPPSSNQLANCRNPAEVLAALRRHRGHKSRGPERADGPLAVQSPPSSLRSRSFPGLFLPLYSFSSDRLTDNPNLSDTPPTKCKARNLWGGGREYYDVPGAEVSKALRRSTGAEGTYRTWVGQGLSLRVAGGKRYIVDQRKPGESGMCQGIVLILYPIRPVSVSEG